MLAAIEAGWADPRRLHREGRAARRLLDQAREVLAEGLGVRPSEVAFAPDGPTAVRWMADGLRYAGRRRGARVVASAVEHSAVLVPGRHAADAARRPDRPSRRSGVDRAGRVDLDAWRAAVAAPGDGGRPAPARQRRGGHPPAARRRRSRPAARPGCRSAWTRRRRLGRVTRTAGLRRAGGRRHVLGRTRRARPPRGPGAHPVAAAGRGRPGRDARAVPRRHAPWVPLALPRPRPGSRPSRAARPTRARRSRWWTGSGRPRRRSRTSTSSATPWPGCPTS